MQCTYNTSSITHTHTHTCKHFGGKEKYTQKIISAVNFKHFSGSSQFKEGIGQIQLKRMDHFLK